MSRRDFNDTAVKPAAKDAPKKETTEAFEKLIEELKKGSEAKAKEMEKKEKELEKKNEDAKKENESLKKKVEEMENENEELKKKTATAECKKAALSGATDLTDIMTKADILRLLFATPEEKEKFIQNAKEVARIKKENKAANEALGETADAAGFIDG